MRKKIQELRFSTYILFVGVVSLILILTVLLAINGNYEYRAEQGLVQPTSTEKSPTSFENLVDSINISVASQGFVIALFPIYSSMGRSSKPHVMTSVISALVFTVSIYTYLAFISAAYFGE